MYSLLLYDILAGRYYYSRLITNLCKTSVFLLLLFLASPPSIRNWGVFLKARVRVFVIMYWYQKHKYTLL